MTPLHTDLYQLTMAQAYQASGIGREEACFHLYFRENPFGGGYTVAAGLQQALEWIESWRFAEKDVEYLAGLLGNDGKPLFHREFLDALGTMRLTCDIDAVPEGTVVFPREPLVRVTGPIMECQLVETALLNIVNFQTLVATKAARVVHAAAGDPVVEFGLRRAQGPDGGLSASRAAYVGGCAGTSNTLAGITFGIPVSGTLAHSWVMAFDSEIEAFEAYARVMPNNCVFLVDTYDTLQGVANAIEVGRRMRERGHEMGGVRIDSGDLAWLSRKARAALDEAGFPDAKIVASNELDEHLIASLKEQGAAVDVWGVGTKLVTASDQPALGGVYKLSAVRVPGSAAWTPRIKLSEQTIKVTTPGVLGVRRYRKADGTLAGDMVHDVSQAFDVPVEMVDPADGTRRTIYAPDAPAQELLVAVVRHGERVCDSPALVEIRKRTMEGVSELDDSHLRFLNPHTYKVGLARDVYNVREAMILETRGVEPGSD
jgi:nicotinate phosphoribosyltransferase